MYSNDLENIFVMLMLTIDLKEQNKKGSIFTKNYAWSFTVEEATDKMCDMSVEINSNSTTTTISCGVKKSHHALVFLHRFMAAKYIHCPADRTRQEPKNSVLLQPTAKGIHIMERYCHRNGIHPTKNIELLFESNYNTMQIVALERQPHSDIILQSDAFIYLLLQRFLGQGPNVYSPADGPEDLPGGNGISPYAHRYFTHPESDSL